MLFTLHLQAANLIGILVSLTNRFVPLDPIRRAVPVHEFAIQNNRTRATTPSIFHFFNSQADNATNEEVTKPKIGLPPENLPQAGPLPGAIPTNHLQIALRQALPLHNSWSPSVNGIAKRGFLSGHSKVDIQ
ncbi:hypothetical protein BJX63DRAFT_248506 [Aspergillus granulosus]|uniref:Uncharacterized protein n=1 Tax=Aspergillus granulosus TaxID=176169 RepID=A0ABR4H9X4_9EURO